LGSSPPGAGARLLKKWPIDSIQQTTFSEKFFKLVAHDQRQLFFPFNDNYYSRRGTIIGLAIGQRWRVLPQEKILP